MSREKSKKFKFKTTGINIHSIYLFDEINSKYIEIPNADPEFCDISLEEFELIKDVLKENEYPIDTTTIMKAREDITDFIRGSKAKKRQLIRHQKSKRRREQDLNDQVPVSMQNSENPEETLEQDNEKTWTPTKFEIELPR